MSVPQLVYNASPTLARFHADDHFVRGVRGPIGSGKSVGMCMEIVSRALRQPPGWDGVRRSRWAVVRNTYPELKSTTIKTWTDWIKEEWYGPVVYSSPIMHKIWLNDRTYLEVLFIAMDRPEEVRKVLSLELTGAWINEAREVPLDILDGVSGRVGRYPKKADVEPYWSGVILDTNAPDDMHWWYKFAEDDAWLWDEKEERMRSRDEIPVAESFKFYSQPSGLSDEAENIQNLTEGYYRRLMIGKTKAWTRVYVHGKYGATQDGKAVYAEDWDEEEHVSERDLLPLPNHEIILGWDFGLTPACIIGQVSPTGQLRILDEVIGDNVGVKRFARDQVLPLLRTRYKDCPIISVGDPGSSRAETDENTVFNILADPEIGIPTTPAPSNAITRRLESVRFWLGLRLGRTPGFQVSRRCTVLRRGFSSGYMYKRMQVAGAIPRYVDKPYKNWASHPHDALQYLCMQLAPDMRQSDSQPPPRIEFAPADAVAGF